MDKHSLQFMITQLIIVLDETQDYMSRQNLKETIRIFMRKLAVENKKEKPHGQNV